MGASQANEPKGRKDYVEDGPRMGDQGLLRGRDPLDVRAC